MNCGMNEISVAFFIDSFSILSIEIANLRIKGTREKSNKCSLSVKTSLMSSSACTPYSRSSKNISMLSSMMFWLSLLPLTNMMRNVYDFSTTFR